MASLPDQVQHLTLRNGMGDPIPITMEVIDQPSDDRQVLAAEYRVEMWRTPVGLHSRSMPPPFPWVGVRVRLQPELVLAVSGLDAPTGEMDFPRELLLYAAPQATETVLDQILSGELPRERAHRVVRVSIANRSDLKASKEATGETYEQRSHMCYEDLCRIACAIWREVHRPNDFDLAYLRGSKAKRRAYEDAEWINAIRWGQGDGFWSETGSTNMECQLVGAKMRELEDRLAGSGLGVLPEVVGRVDLGPGLRFVPDARLRDSIERDCREINAAAKAGSAKAVIILCGSVVEALLYGLLKDKDAAAKDTARELADSTNDRRAKRAFSDAAKADLSRWKAEVLIHVAHKVEPQRVTEDAAAYAHVLRDYRNLIHPGKEARSGKSVDQHTASIAVSVLNLVVRGLANPSGTPSLPSSQT